MTSYYRSIVTMGLSRTVSEINGDFSRKSQIFPPRVFNAPLKEFPWNWVSALGVKKLEWWGYQADQEVWQYLQPCGVDTIHQRDSQTDGPTDTGRRQIPRLRIASRGNNVRAMLHVNTRLPQLWTCEVLTRHRTLRWFGENKIFVHSSPPCSDT